MSGVLFYLQLVSFVICAKIFIHFLWLFFARLRWYRINKQTHRDKRRQEEADIVREKRKLLLPFRQQFFSQAIFHKKSFVDEIRYWFLLSQLRYLNIKVNRSANEMLFCLAFHWSFSFFLVFSHILISSFLNSNQQLNNNEIWRSFALWFLFFFFRFFFLSPFIRGLLKNFFSLLLRSHCAIV